MATSSTTIQEQIDRLKTVKKEINEQLYGYLGIGGGEDTPLAKTSADIGRQLGAFNKSIKPDPDDGIYLFFEFHKDKVPEFNKYVNTISDTGDSGKYPYIQKVNNIERTISPIHVCLGNMDLSYFIVSDVLNGAKSDDDYQYIELKLYCPKFIEDVSYYLYPLCFCHDCDGSIDVLSGMYGTITPYELSYEDKTLSFAWYHFTGSKVYGNADQFFFQPDDIEHFENFYTNKDEGTYTKLFYKLVWEK